MLTFISCTDSTPSPKPSATPKTLRLLWIYHFASFAIGRLYIRFGYLRLETTSKIINQFSWKKKRLDLNVSTRSMLILFRRNNYYTFSDSFQIFKAISPNLTEVGAWSLILPNAKIKKNRDLWGHDSSNEMRELKINCV